MRKWLLEGIPRVRVVGEANSYLQAVTWAWVSSQGGSGVGVVFMGG